MYVFVYKDRYFLFLQMGRFSQIATALALPSSQHCKIVHLTALCMRKSKTALQCHRLVSSIFGNFPPPKSLAGNLAPPWSLVFHMQLRAFTLLGC